jgi:hypothetical protein
MISNKINGEITAISLFDLILSNWLSAYSKKSSSRKYEIQTEVSK